MWDFREPGEWGAKQPGSSVGKGPGSRRINSGSSEQRKRSREKGVEENDKRVTQKPLREQGESKNNLGSIEKLIWGAPKK